MVKNPPANRDADLVPGTGRSLEEGMATHSSILEYMVFLKKYQGEGTFGGLQRVRHD